MWIRRDGAKRAIAFPTDARLLYRMRETLIRTAKERKIKLRQSYVKVQGGEESTDYASRYAVTKQGKRATKQTRKFRTYLGRVVRDIDRKALKKNVQLIELLPQANRLLVQGRHNKNKLYSVHAPEVECIAKGKVHKRHKFGNKISFVTISKSNWWWGLRVCKGIRTTVIRSKRVLEQINEICGRAVKTAYCD